MKILAIGAHPDDIELYCGGTLLKAIDRGHEVRMLVCTNGELQSRKRYDEQVKACKFLKVKKIYFLNMKDGRLEHGVDLISQVDEVIKTYKPDTVFSHCLEDTHQDHLAVAKSVRSANRGWNFNWITYPSYDLRINFIPNLFVDIAGYFSKKSKLLEIFKSQKDKWFFADGGISEVVMGPFTDKVFEKFKIEFFTY